MQEEARSDEVHQHLEHDYVLYRDHCLHIVLGHHRADNLGAALWHDIPIHRSLRPPRPAHNLEYRLLDLLHVHFQPQNHS